MNVQHVQEKLEDFLRDDGCSVLCLEGKWGTGKSHIWDAAIKAVAAANALRPKHYAYVSLFGIKEASDILQTIYVHAENPTESKSSAGVLNSLKRKGTSIAKFVSDHATIPHVTGLGGVARAAISMLVKETVVCIDDFERKNDALAMKEVMGIVAHLRDSRKCKVAIILNEDSLSSDEREAFQRYSEKVIDLKIKFQPTAAETTAIAFPTDDKVSRTLKQAAQELGITNIRLLQKLKRFSSVLLRELPCDRHEVVREVLRSFVVLFWVVTTPKGEGAPSLEYLEGRVQNYLMDNSGKSTDEIRWEELLDKFRFSHCDDLDKALIYGIQNGFFDKKELARQVEIYSENDNRRKAETAMKEAWEPFHDSFEDNKDEVAKSIYDSCISNLKYLSPGSLNSAFKILGICNFRELADDILTKFLAIHADNENIFGDPHWFEAPESAVAEAFQSRREKKESMLPSPLQAARHFYKDRGRSSKDEAALALLSSDDFERLFLSHHGEDRNVLIRGALFFRRISNATDTQKSICENAKAALISIGRKSPLNAARLLRYGISSSDINGSNNADADPNAKNPSG